MKKLVIISGVSGAGKTTASNYLEDKGYRCIDQYPPELLKELINLIDNDDSFKYQNVVLTISPFDLDKAVTLLTNTNFKVTLILIDADKETIINRYKFTRRIHPLLTNNVADTLSEALDIEKNILYKYKDRGFLINTTNLPVRAFQDQINRALNDIEDKNLSLSFVSFGFKNGIPKDCDVIFDVRFLDNPFYVEELKENDIKFLNPFLPFDCKKLAETIMELPEFAEYNFTKKELLTAAKKAEEEYQKFKQDIRDKGEETLEYMNKNNLKGIVLAGRPYHVDPEVNHGIDTLITSLGLCVLTEDSICNQTEVKRPIRVVDQWVFHARLYAAADFVGKHDNLELVQLNSFGCGVDAVTTDQVEEILNSFGKMYTLIKIDEINNLGAVRIRIRSLLASMKKREQNKELEKGSGNYEQVKKIFDKDMKKDYTILIPQMAPIHFELLEAAVASCGYKVELLRNCTQHTVETGLKYVNNDACYPSILTTGQMIEALESGKYDLNKTALIMSQTGGGCRATNYIGFIRKALKDAGFANVPVISFNVVGMEKMPGFKITIPMIERMIKCVVYADLLQKMLTKNRAYEIHKGETQKLFDEWMEKCKTLVVKSTMKEFKQSIYDIVNDFEKIELDTSFEKPKVGIVGEVLIKYHPFGNNFVADKLEEEGAEVILPDFMGFVKFIATHKITFNQLIKTDKMKAKLFKAAIKLIDILEKDSVIALKNSKKGYLLPCNIFGLETKVKDILSIGNQTGEGWFLTAEMVEYIEHGIPNIVCVQPFACLPNHVVGKGVIKTIRNKYPDANIAPVDYDPGASEANQTNRIKLLMTVAKDNIKNKLCAV